MVYEIDFWKLMTILLAAFVAWVAYQQYSLGREKFKLDLFEKRFAVFAATRQLLILILRDANISLEQFFEFRASVEEASFLFDSDITAYLDSIGEKALRLRTLTEMMKPLPVGVQRSDPQEIVEMLKWLTDQLPELKVRFGPYLKFRAWK